MVQEEGGADPIIIKKYANRRLYNTATSRYVTLEQLSEMVKAGQDFQVVDAKSGKDITRSVLTQIIFEEESKGHNLLPVRFLRQLIGMYGDTLQPFVPAYLETSMETFLKNQGSMREQLASAFGSVPPLKQFEELTKHNLALMDKAMRRFMPFNSTTEKPADEETPPSPQAPDAGDQISTLMSRIDAMQSQLDAMAKRDGDKD